MQAKRPLLFLLLMALAGAVFAGKPPVFTKKDLAIRGYDPVAYFTESKPVEGEKTFRTDWNGATWLFANQANLDRFRAEPERYAPQFGGYCAWAVAQGKTAPTDPDAWKIVDGKLYLNYNSSIQKKWEKDITGFIAQANANWPGVLD